MKFPLFGLIRMAAIVGLGLGMLAVGLGQMNVPSTEQRSQAPVVYVGLGEHPASRVDPGTPLLNRQTGLVERLVLPAEEELSQASCSPWHDEGGHVQIVGRWRRRGPGPFANESGLARYAFPGGPALDCIKTPNQPVGPPCWYPGTSARVLFAAGDGHLYHFAFEETHGDDDQAEVADTRPRPLAWRELPPELCHVRMADPTWPADPALGGRLLVALSAGTRVGTAIQFREPKLWWLQLDPSGTRIEASGRLTQPDASTDDRAEERLPSLGRSAAGAPLLAYLARRPSEPGWRLLVAPLRVDADTGVPTVATSAARVLAKGCEPVAPAFALDGRTLACVTTPNGDAPEVHRLPLVPTDR